MFIRIQEMDIDHQSQADNYNDDDDSEPTGNDGNSYEEDSDGTVYHDDERPKFCNKLQRSWRSQLKRLRQRCASSMD